MTNDVHVIDVKSALTKPKTVEVDGELVAQTDKTAFFGWEGTLEFHISDGSERREAAVAVGTHWFHDKITKCLLIVDSQILYREAES